jgi:hypothetical protein
VPWTNERRGELGTPAAFLSGDTARRADDIHSRIISVRQSKTILAKIILLLFEIALVLVRLDHVASVIVNANHSIM